MNQGIKEAVYNRGTEKQMRFMASMGGMNDEETELFKLIHEGKSDLFIEQELAMSRKARSRVESAVRAKLLLAVFQCIDYTMEHKT